MERRLWLALALTPGLGAVGIRRLCEAFGGVRQVFAAGKALLAESNCLRRDALAALADRRDHLLAAADAEMRRAEQAEVTLLCPADPDYPPLLAAIPDPPPVLYVRGEVALLARPGVAVVGARAATTYGLRVAERLSSELARAGLSIISGFALGIDSAAHRGALTAGGPTVAVMGCGLDVDYPSQNRALREGILTGGGVLVSESPMGALPEGYRFPARNRIVSGLALGVLVVEAARRSGTLITARQALEQGRDVFAVPGRIDSAKSEGCHRLVQEGAKLVHCAADVFDELGFGAAALAATSPRGDDQAAMAALSEEERRLLACLDVYPRSVEEIVEASGLSAQRTSELLLHLEMAGLAAALPGGQYQRFSGV